MFSAPTSYALSLSARGSVANDATYTEQKWATTSYDASTLQSIQWIVTLVDETGWNAWDWDSRSDALIPALERKGVPSGVTDNLDYTKAIAGIQAAIWYFTDGIAIDRERTDEAVLGLFDFLTGPENEGLTEPAGRGSQSVSLSPANLSGEAGSTVGPFTVNTDQTTALLSARDAGAWGGELLLVDEHGDELTGEPGVWGIHVSDGTNAYVELPDTYTSDDSAFIEAVVIRSWPGIVLEAEGESADLLLLDATEAVRTSSDISVTATPSPEPTSEPSTSAPTPTDPTSTPTTTPPGDTLPDTGTPSSAATALIGVLTLGIGTLLILGRKRLTNSQHH